MAPTVMAVVLAFAGCTSERELVSQKEDHLAAAGFVVQPASTPQRQAMVNRLPPHHFLQRAHGDTVSYVYADPLVCDCLYVGSQQAYARYRSYVQQKELADEQLSAAEAYSDATWDWGAWGPWYPGFVGGFGW